MAGTYDEWKEHALPGSGWLVEYKNDGADDASSSALTPQKTASLVKLLEICSSDQHKFEDRMLWLPNAATGGTLCKYVMGNMTGPDDSAPFGTITFRHVGDYHNIKLKHAACVPRPVQVTFRDAPDPAYVTLVAANPLNGLELFVADFPANEPIRCLEIRENLRMYLMRVGQLSKYQLVQIVQDARILRGNALVYKGNAQRHRRGRARVVWNL